MNDEPSHEAVRRLLRLLADRLAGYLEGDELAFETLGEALEEQRCTSEEIQAAVLVIRSLIGAAASESEATVEGIPGKHAQRVWSHEERASLTPESWGLLLDLKRRGSLDAEQFERVLDVLISQVDRPVGVDVAREVAARVALSSDSNEGIPEDDRGEHELAH
jgi:uncharacterized protein Smg (DUF494 family)